MFRLQLLFPITVACFIWSSAQADVPPLTPLYGISAGSDLRTLETTFGKPSMRIPFEDGWVAFVFKFKDHNVVVETSPDDQVHVAAVQIAGLHNPFGKGLLGVNLGDTVNHALDVFGTPVERRPSIDEKTSKAIPDAYIYQYNTASFESTNGKITSLKVHFSDPSGAAQGLVPQSQIQPAELLTYAYQEWRAFVEEKYKCKDAKVISAKPNKVPTKGVVTERWQTNVCGQLRTFVPFLTPDGNGGYLVGFGE
jgi:hypothetical protein